MYIERNRCWLRHRHKEEWDRCPLCNAPIRWIYVDSEWTPCDREGVTYKRDFEGDLLIYDGNGLKDCCKLYSVGDSGRFKIGLLPHVYSCDELKGYHGIKVDRI